MSDPSLLSAVEAARAMAAGKLSPVDLLDAYLARIDRHEAALNVFIALDRDAARTAARAAEAELRAGRRRGPLHGLPIGIKDIVDVAGLRTTCHSRLRLDAPPTIEDAVCVAALRGAGGLVVGKLATHEFAIGGPSFDLPFPPARNPWNRDHHPGGASSGSGAGLAAGFFPLAVGTDTGGSVRNPASACGVVGLKPTYGLVSRRGVQPLSFTLDHVGPMARTVADCALMLQVMAAHDPADPGSAPAPRVDYARSLESGVRGLRIGVVRHFHDADHVAHPGVAAALDEVVRTLAAEGAQVADIRLPPLARFATVNRVILMAEAFAIHGNDLRERPEGFCQSSRRRMLVGAFVGGADYVQANRQRLELMVAVDAALAEVDVLLCASSMDPPCRIDDAGEVERTYPRQARTPFNVTGHPALAMMSGLSRDGLPLSVQFAGRNFDEATVLRVARAWERASGIDRKRPALAA